MEASDHYCQLPQVVAVLLVPALTLPESPQTTASTIAGEQSVRVTQNTKHDVASHHTRTIPLP